jgi:NAD(P)H-dependent flavin oxidoreductase YrpB (nitropropane dioxygenase family)
MRRILMRRILLVLSVAAMLVVASPASAQAGCQAFGQGLAAEAQKEPGNLAEDVRAAAPVNDEVVAFKAFFCS